MLYVRKSGFLFWVFCAVSVMLCCRCQGQAALLLEEPYGFFGTLNPTGHNAIYFSRICAETPTKLRRCHAGELGSVVARYQGINKYDWIAVTLVPYFYSVESVQEIPERVTREQVELLRDSYYETHLQSLDDPDRGGFTHGGWTQLLGTAFERRTYIFRFNTTEDQDDAFIAMMNDKTNRSHFNLFYNNCADFARQVLNMYFPRTFRRSMFPDAGMTTPKQISYKLAHYARKHPSVHLQIFVIPQIPGYRRMSHANKSISESLTTTAYAVPILLLNPYLAGGIFIDFLARGRFHLVLRNQQVLSPTDLSSLTDPAEPLENPGIAGKHAIGAAAGPPPFVEVPQTQNTGLEGIRNSNE